MKLLLTTIPLLILVLTAVAQEDNPERLFVNKPFAIDGTFQAEKDGEQDLYFEYGSKGGVRYSIDRVDGSAYFQSSPDSELPWDAKRVPTAKSRNLETFTKLMSVNWSAYIYREKMSSVRCVMSKKNGVRLTASKSHEGNITYRLWPSSRVENGYSPIKIWVDDRKPLISEDTIAIDDSIQIKKFIEDARNGETINVWYNRMPDGPLVALDTSAFGFAVAADYCEWALRNMK